jgi:hypothetical protein
MPGPNETAPLLPPDSLRLVGRALKDWDPLAVLRGCGFPESEYDAYAPHIVSMVAQGASVDEVAAHLGRLRSETLGAHRDDEDDRRIALLIDQLIGPKK